MMPRIVIVLTLLVVLAAAAVAVPGDGPVLRLSDGKRIQLGGMTAELAKARVVFVGEVHSVPEHHRIELAVIRALHEADVPFMIGLEMFRSEYQDGLDRWIAGSMDEKSFRKLYERNWNLPWGFYRDILLYAREHKLPLVGLNVDEGVAGKVARSGFASLTPQERAKLPHGITCNVDDTYEEFIKRAHGHAMQSGKAFRYFCEAQMVWDSAMANTLAAALARDPRRSAVVLAGSGHSWRHGIPTQLSRISPGVRSVVVLPALDNEMTDRSVTKKDADYLVF